MIAAGGSRTRPAWYATATRHLLWIVIVLGVTTAQAAPPRRFTVTWNEHLHGSDGTEKTVKTLLIVNGSKLHFEWTYAGPRPDKPRNRPQNVDAVLENDLVVDRALAALDKIAVTPTRPAAPAAVDDRTGCLTRGERTRCENARGDEAEGPGFAALTDLSIALIENLQRR